MLPLSSTRPITAPRDYIEGIPVVPTIPTARAPRSAVDQMVAVRRLVVLVPDAEVDESRLATRLWSMASGPGLSILLLGMVRDTFREAGAQRRLATLAAIARDKRTQVDARVGIGTRWEPLVQSVWQPGDLLVCHAEQSKSILGIRREPLAPALAANLNIPVYAVAGFYPELPPDLPEWISRSLGVVPVVLLLAGFLAALAAIQRLTTGPVQTVLLCLAVVIEYVLIAAWETFATRQSFG